MKRIEIDDVAALLRLVERSVHRSISGPQDFTYLSDVIYLRTNDKISSSTIKRLWGYDTPVRKPYYNTLCVLARFIGYKDYRDFVNDKRAGERSSLTYTAFSLKASDLFVNDRVVLQWKPDRLCIVIYKGDNSFEVLESQNTKLQTGDKFCAMLFTEGIPAYLDQFRSKDEPHFPSTYVIGWEGGLTHIHVTETTRPEEQQESEEQQ